MCCPKRRESSQLNGHVFMFSNVSFVFHILKRCGVSKINPADKGVGNCILQLCME